MIKQRQFRFVSIVLMIETKQAFLELYDKVDADFKMPIDEEVQS